MSKNYVDFSVPNELAEEVLNVLETISTSGGIIKKGTNETTKALERGIAKIIVIAEDIEPEEIVMHLPILAKEKGIAHVFVSTKQELGGAIGISVSSSAIAITDAGKAKDKLDDLIAKIKKIQSSGTSKPAEK
ncbi:MAG: 50S ribosomal protein L7Ae [DPANN group archaeon]|nr:50S ribosomal protein L7Ae [DPANN group archaeon]